MNEPERAMLRDFLDQLVRVRGIQKIPEADAMITRALIEQPDAAYLLVQKALLLEQALAHARARNAALEASGEQEFLDTASPTTPASARAPAAAAGPGSPAPSMPARGAGAASFLGQAAATAAGVAGGAFLFEGLEGLLDHRGSIAVGASDAGPPEDVTINNYYASDNQAATEVSDAGVDDSDFI